MKKQAFVLSLALAGFLLSLPSCQKESPLPGPAEEFIPLDTVNNLVGFFLSAAEIALIDPAYLEDVLAEWGASPTSAENVYYMQVILPDGTTLEFKFAVEQIPAPELFLIADGLQKELESTEVDEFGQVIRKTFRHARCPSNDEISGWRDTQSSSSATEEQKKEAAEKLKEGFRDQANDGDCTNLEQVDPQTGAASFKVDIEKSYKRCMYSISARDACTETRTVVGTVHYYNDLDCEGEAAEVYNPDTQQLEAYTRSYRQFSCGEF